MFAKKKKEEEKIELVLAITTKDNYETSVVKSALEEENIPYFIQERGMGGYMKIYMGFSVYGSDIYIPKQQEEKVKEILQNLFIKEIQEEQNEE